MLIRTALFSIASSILVCITGLCFAEQLSAQSQVSSAPFEHEVKVIKIDSGFKVEATYRVSIPQCVAYNFLTDYEGAKDIPGILESKVISRSGNKVLVERLIQERILLFPIKMRSRVEYLEIPNKGLDFHQISGDTKLYEGTWRLINDGDAIRFKYQSVIAPNSLIPNFVIRHFIEHSIHQRFEKMAQNAFQYGMEHSSECH